MRKAGPDGKARHAEMALGETGIVHDSGRADLARTPKRVEGQVTHNVYARIDNVDAFERATKPERSYWRSRPISCSASAAAGSKTPRVIAGTSRSPRILRLPAARRSG